MIEGGENLGFTLETGQALGIRGHGLGQHLDRDLAAELGVLREIDLTHAAFAELGGDLEMRKSRADHVDMRPAQGPAASRFGSVVPIMVA